MAEVSNTVVIDAPPERIWDMITSWRYLQLWLADVTAVDLGRSFSSGAGTIFEVRRKGIATGPQTWGVVEWQPPRRLRLAEQGKASWIFELEPIGQQTRLTLTYQWPQRGLIMRLVPATGQRRLVRSSLDRLKELIIFNRDIALVHGIGDE